MPVPPRIALTVALVETVLGAAGVVWEIAQRVRDRRVSRE